MPGSSDHELISEYSLSKEHSFAKKKKKKIFSSRLSNLEGTDPSKPTSNRSILKKKNFFASEKINKKQKSVCFKLETQSADRQSQLQSSQTDSEKNSLPNPKPKQNIKQSEGQIFCDQFRKVSLEQETHSGMSEDRNPIANSDDLINIEIQELKNLEIREMLDSLQNSDDSKSLDFAKLVLRENSLEPATAHDNSKNLNFSKKSEAREELLQSQTKLPKSPNPNSDPNIKKIFQKQIPPKSGSNGSGNLSGDFLDRNLPVDSKASCDRNSENFGELDQNKKNPFYFRSKTMGELSGFEKSYGGLTVEEDEIAETKFDFEEALRSSLDMKFKKYFKTSWKDKKKELRALSPYGGLKSYKIRQIIVKVIFF